MFELLQKGAISYILPHFAPSVLPAALLLGYFVTALIAYLLGSVDFAIIISKYFYHDDVRKHGSGNAGMTNMLRTYGKAAAGLTLLGDALKTALAILIGNLLMGAGNEFLPGGYLAGLLVIIGHAWPIFYKFKGGKGVVASAIVILINSPIVFLIVFVMFAIVLLLSRYMSMASITGMLVYPLVLRTMYNSVTHPEVQGLATVCAVFMTLLVIFLHRENLRRLRDGTESKFSFKRQAEPAAATVDSSATEVKRRSGVARKKKGGKKKR